jgi:transcriptional regulator with XRE-family HTH domain
MKKGEIMGKVNFEGILAGIGKIVKQARKDMNLSIADLAKKADVSVGVISDLENYKGRVPTLINFVKLANALELPSTMFIDLFQDKVRACSDLEKPEKYLEAALIGYGVDLFIIPHIINYIDMVKKSGITMDINNHRARYFK